MKVDSNTFYVYTHHRATDGAVFYVGKGTKGRAFKTHGRNVYWKRVVAKYGYFVTIVADGLTETEALAKESALISELGKIALCNMTDGGEGMSGYRHSENGKLKIAASKVGKPRPQAAVEKMRQSKLGKKASEATRQKMSNARRGYSHSPEAIQKMRDKANARTAETIAKQVAANTGKSRSNAARENMRAAQKGKTVECSNGMTFEKLADAARWLKENGHPKASVQAIAKASSAKHRIAYGFGWKIKEDFCRFAPTL